MVTNFWNLHHQLIINGEFESARWLYNQVLKLNRPSRLNVTLTNNHAWCVGKYVINFNGFGINLEY